MAQIRNQSEPDSVSVAGFWLTQTDRGSRGMAGQVLINQVSPWQLPKTVTQLALCPHTAQA